MRCPATPSGALRDPWGAVSDTVTTARSLARFVRPITTTLSPIMTERRLTWHYDVLELPVADLKRAAKADGAEGSLNDAFLGRHHRRPPALPRAARRARRRELRVAMPISVRRADDPEGGNRVTLVRFAVPISLAHPSVRLREIKRICGELRHEAGHPVLGRRRRACSTCSRTRSPAACSSTSTSWPATCPGSDEPVWLAARG